MQAYLYAYPLVLMDATERVSLSRGLSVNHFAHIVNLSTPASRVVVYPNVDTLYSSAWLDLTKGPQTLHVPDMHGRYYTMQFMDAYSDNFAYVGTRTNGGKARDYVIVPPGWKGGAPSGMERIVSPTNTVWLLGRMVARRRRPGAGPRAAAAVHLTDRGRSPRRRRGSPLSIRRRSRWQR